MQRIDFLEIYKRQLSDVVPALQVCLQKQDAAGLSAFFTPVILSAQRYFDDRAGTSTHCGRGGSFKLTVLQLLEPCGSRW